MNQRQKLIAFDRVASAALRQADMILARWLPSGRREGHEWVSRNPKRTDRKLGSFKINMTTGAWGDFAVNARGGDLVSLGAYLGDLNQRQAAINIAKMLGVDPYEQ